MIKVISILLVSSMILAAAPMGEPQPQPPNPGEMQSTPLPPPPPGWVKLTPTPAPIQTPEEVEIWATPVPQDILGLINSQGYVLCPDEEIILTDKGIAFICQGENPSLANFAPVWAVALLDGPWPGFADVAVILSIATVATAANVALQPQVLLAKNPAILPDVVVPEGIPAPPAHLQNHPGGAYASKLKSLGWVAVFTAWAYAINGGPPPDFCGVREDGALLVVYYSARVVTVTNKIYQGFGVIVNQGGDHLSTVLIKLDPPAGGALPESNNTSGNDFSQFLPIEFGKCPPPPAVVSQ